MKESNKKIIELLANGKTVKEVAAELDMNRRTVEARINKLKSVNNCTTIAQLLVKILTVNTSS